MNFIFLKTLVARVLSNVVGHFLLTYVIGSRFGSAGVGQYTILISLIIFVCSLSSYGYANALTKHAAINNKGVSLFLLKRSLGISVILAFLIAVLIFFGMEFFLSLIDKSETKELLLLGIFASPLYCGTLVMSGYFKGIKKPVCASFMEHGSIALGTSLFTYVFSCFFGLSISLGGGIFLSSFLTFMLGMVKSGFFEFKVVRPSRDVLNLFVLNSRVFFVNSLTSLIKVSVVPLIIASQITTEEMGWFRISEQLAMGVGFVVMVIATIYPPKFAFNYKNNEKIGGLVDIYRESRGFGLLLALPALLFVLAFSKQLSVLFIGDYNSVIFEMILLLCVAQFVEVLIGPIDYLLMMSGLDKEFVKIKILLAVVLVLCLLFLGSSMTVLKAAYCLSAYIVLLRVISYVCFAKKNDYKLV